ncbi:DNA-binding protein [Streptomyces sp. DH-12]|uniref:TraR/DksA family transcriptional regulator n=1 Tax=Streptomyces sp. DH-12 TaxID=2072509 RepID=UPI000CCEEE3C|nr:TraR/DksA family transcriptional regulator [Streptomyces sp. DH-12]PNV35020.1 DNA-binding protein [Streptomyces sp. DH-12]
MVAKKGAAAEAAGTGAGAAGTVSGTTASGTTASRRATAKAAGEKAAARKPAGEEPPRGAAGEAAAGGQGAGGRQGARAGNGAVRTSGSAQDGAGHSAADDAGAADAAAQTGVTTVGAKKTPGPAATAAATAVPKARHGAVEPGELAVRPGEEPWTGEEVEEARTELMSEVLRLREEISSSERSLAGLMRDPGDGAGHDDADTGTKNITREHELALAANAREMLDQFERALQRLDAGTYGLCENCGEPIGKARMQAFPRATLCVECKQKQERRY